MNFSNNNVLSSKEQILLLPTFKNLPHSQIILINRLEQCEVLREELSQAILLGFDSESKPTFSKGEIQTGPHLIQLATATTAYLFQMNAETWRFLTPFLANPQQLKAGFGLKNDAHLFRKKGIELNGVIELSKCFGSFGIKHTMGVKNAIALLFKQNFPKSKKISTSNWSAKNLSRAQIEYAAADAYACVLIFNELSRLNLLPEHVLKQIAQQTKLGVKI